MPLSDCVAGTVGAVVENTGTRAMEMGFYPGAAVQVLSNEQGGDALVVSVGESRFVVPPAIAATVHIARGCGTRALRARRRWWWGLRGGGMRSPLPVAAGCSKVDPVPAASVPPGAAGAGGACGLLGAICTYLKTQGPSETAALARRMETDVSAMQGMLSFLEARGRVRQVRLDSGGGCAGCKGCGLGGKPRGGNAATDEITYWELVPQE